MQISMFLSCSEKRYTWDTSCNQLTPVGLVKWPPWWKGPRDQVSDGSKSPPVFSQTVVQGDDLRLVLRHSMLCLRVSSALLKITIAAFNILLIKGASRHDWLDLKDNVQNLWVQSKNHAWETYNEHSWIHNATVEYIKSGSGNFFTPKNLIPAHLTQPKTGGGTKYCSHFVIIAFWNLGVVSLMRILFSLEK